MKIQCGYEDECKIDDCRDCDKTLSINNKITLAEATCIENFGIVDLDQWAKDWDGEREKQRDLAQRIMFDLSKKIDWNDMK